MTDRKQDKHQPLILVVDDTQVLRILMRQVLIKYGYDVVEADSGQRAIDIFKRRRPDLVILDVLMPEMDGFATCERLRTLPGGATVPIIIATALEDEESIEKAFHAGATDFVAKPISAALLGNRLRYILRSAENVLQLARSEAKHRALIDTLPDTLIRISAEGICLDVRGVERLAPSWLPSESYIGHPLSDLLPADVIKEIHSFMNRASSHRRMQVFSLQILVDGIVRDVDARLVVADEGEATLILRDVTEFRLAESQIRFLVAHDNLTQLPTRRLFQDRVEQALLRAHREDNGVAILYVDLDSFKAINDQYGHDVGDAVLQAITKRLQRFVRKTDSIARGHRELVSSIARFAGDEFTLMISGDWSIADVAKVSRRLLNIIREPIHHDSREIVLTGSIGIAVYPNDGDHPDILCTRAETAMRRAKENGGDSYQFHDFELNANAFERLSLENNLRRAIDFNEMLLYYQPHIDLATGVVVAMEALVRWDHPDLGVVLPGEFLPLARETGLVIAIDRWVLRQACMQQRAWVKDGLPNVALAINVSAHWINDGDVVEAIEQILEETAFPPDKLILEFSETAVLNATESLVTSLKTLRALGVNITLDNFGTGFSSLGFLTRFPVTALKIDQTFVSGLPDKSAAVDTVEAIVAMAKRMHLDLMAECVESAPQLAYLRDIGCKVAQGHLLSPPMPAAKARYVLQAGEISVL